MELIRAAWRENAPVRALTLTAQALVEEARRANSSIGPPPAPPPAGTSWRSRKAAMDGIRGKFGRDAIAPASTVHRDRAEVKRSSACPRGLNIWMPPGRGGFIMIKAIFFDVDGTCALPPDRPDFSAQRACIRASCVPVEPWCFCPPAGTFWSCGASRWGDGV